MPTGQQKVTRESGTDKYSIHVVVDSITAGTLTTVAPTAATPTHTADATVDNTAGGVTVLAANTSRKAAIIQVVSGGNVRVSIAGTPTTSTGLQLVAGGAPLVIEGTASYGCPTGAIKAIREGSTSGVVAVVEFA